MDNFEEIKKMNLHQLNEFDLGHTYQDENIANYVRNKTLYWENGLQRYEDAYKDAEKKFYENDEKSQYQIMGE